MRNLDIATLRSLQAVAEYGAVTRAAQALNLTQSALSMQMKRLEEVFGQPMLKKQGRGVILSDFAAELLIEGRKLVAQNDHIMARFAGARPTSRLRVGLTCDWLFSKVAQAVRDFRRDNLEIGLIINDGRSKNLRDEMARGQHDVILTTEFDELSGAVHLAKVDLIWVGAPQGEAWKQRPLPIANSPHCAYYPIGIDALERAGIAWTPAAAEGGSETWRVAAAADLGISILPRGITQAGLEPVDHRGALPPLPATWLNAYLADGPARAAAVDFVGYLRQAICPMSVVAA